MESKFNASMAKLADALGLEPSELSSCGFDSLYWHTNGLVKTLATIAPTGYRAPGLYPGC